MSGEDETGTGTVTMLRLLLPALARGDIGLCPRCCHALMRKREAALSEAEGAAVIEGWWPKFPAMSRIDNETEICSQCGIDEGLMEAFGSRLPEKEEWGPGFLTDIEELIDEEGGRE